MQMLKRLSQCLAGTTTYLRDQPSKRRRSSQTESPMTCVVIVDPYASGKYLVQKLLESGVPIIVVRSSAELEIYSEVHEQLKSVVAKTIEFAQYDDVRHLAEFIRSLPYEVRAVIPGTECGVELADQLAEALEMPNRNRFDLIKARKDKAETQEQLRKFGLAATAQRKDSELGPLIEWTRKHGKFPVVAKPVEGCGGDGVYFCKTEEDLRNAHQDIIVNQRKNMYGASVPEMVVQEYLEGDEYIVDTISYKGKHILVGIWKYKKVHGLPWNKSAIMPEYSFFLPSQGKDQNRLAAYVFRVLDAVGLRFGPCHSEVMMTKRGPVLVEVNARMHGMQGPLMTEFATGTNIATYTADVMVFDGVLFNELYKAQSPDTGRWMYPLHKNCYMVDLMSPITGVLSCDLEDKIKKLGLASLHDFEPETKPGDVLQQTKDLATEPGCVLLVHESQTQIEKDIKAIRAAEADGFYEIEPLD